MPGKAAIRILEGERQDLMLCAALDDEGQRLATGDFGGCAKILDVASGNRLAGWHAHDVPILHIAVDATASRVATAAKDGTVNVYQATGKRLRSLPHPHGARQLLFVPTDGRLITNGHDGIMRIWDLAREEPVQQFSGHEGPMAILGLPNGRQRLVTVGIDWTVQVRDLDSGEFLAALHCLPDGFLWTAGIDPKDTTGPFWTNHVELMEVEERADRNSILPARSMDKDRARNYLEARNREGQFIVSQRILHGTSDSPAPPFPDGPLRCLPYHASPP